MVLCLIIQLNMGSLKSGHCYTFHIIYYILNKKKKLFSQNYLKYLLSFAKTLYIKEKVFKIIVKRRGSPSKCL